MTNEDKKRTLEAAVDRAYRRIAGYGEDEMELECLHTLMSNILMLEGMIRGLDPKNQHSIFNAVPVFVEKAKVEDPETEDEETETATTTTAETVNDADKPETEAEVTPEPDPDETATEYKMEDVRAALAKARAKGVNVSAIIRSFGVDSFPQISGSQYPAIMAALEKEGK